MKNKLTDKEIKALQDEKARIIKTQNIVKK